MTSVFIRDAARLNANLYAHEAEIEDNIDQIHNRYRSVIHSLVLAFLAQHDEGSGLAYEIQRPLSTQETMEYLTRINRRSSINSHAQNVVEAVNNQFPSSRSQALMNEIDLITADMNIEIQEEIEGCLTYGYEESYYRNSWNIARRSGSLIPIPRLNQSDIQEVLQTNWSGRLYDERLWYNRSSITHRMEEDLLGNAIRGMGILAIAQVVTKRFDSSLWQVKRLLRTEFNQFKSKAREAVYKLFGVEHYTYIAKLDVSTCEDCRRLHGEVFPVEDRQPGVNAASMHSNCRCTDSPARLEIQMIPITFLDWFNSWIR